MAIGRTNISIFKSPVKVWGIEIDETVSDCYNMVSYPATLSTGQGTYTNGAYGATPMSGAGASFNVGSWGSGNYAKLIEGIKPVSFNGTTWADLNKTSETDWPTDRDIFTEFPFRWLSITKSGSKITVMIADSQYAPDSTFQDWAFLGADGTTRRSNFHLGCYTASGSVSGVFSKKGTSNLVSTALNRYWVAASKRGTEYDCLPYQMWVYLQCLFLVLYKSTNCQTTHSKGYSEGGSVQSNSAFADYGNNYGMYGSTSSSTAQNAFFWLHNLWGNMYQFSASVFVRAGSTKAIYYCLSAMSRSSNWDNSSWNNTSTSYRAKQTNIGVASGSVGKAVGDYYTKACGTNGAGFLPASDSGTGSATTYFPDYSSVGSYSSYAVFAYLGGYCGSGDYCGLFCGYVSNSSTTAGVYYGSRLAYRGGHNY